MSDDAFPHLSEDWLDQVLAEDLGEGDWTTEAIVGESVQGRAVIRAKAQGIVAGLPLLKRLFHHLDRQLEISLLTEDGREVMANQEVAQLQGRLRPVLQGERVALNLLMRLSGIATATAQLVQKAKGKVQIYDTRKTTPLLRSLEKYAVRMGGGQNHRMGLFDQILIKENHIRIAGSLQRALQLAKEVAQRRQLLVEIEVETKAQLEEVLPEKPDIVLLDNMSPEEVEACLEVLASYPEVQVEVSGRIGEHNLENYLLPGVHRIAVGAIVHSAPALDFSLTVEEVWS